MKALTASCVPRFIEIFSIIFPIVLLIGCKVLTSAPETLECSRFNHTVHNMWLDTNFIPWLTISWWSSPLAFSCALNALLHSHFMTKNGCQIFQRQHDATSKSFKSLHSNPVYSWFIYFANESFTCTFIAFGRFACALSEIL